MTDKPGPETPTLIAAARTGNFTTVTTLGNKCAQAIKDVSQQGPSAIADTIRKVMPELLQATVSVTFEKAKIWSIIESDPSLKFFSDLDYDSWTNPGDLNKSELEKAKVML